MSFEERLQQELQHQAAAMQVPSELDMRIRRSYRAFRLQQANRKRLMRGKAKPILAAALAGLLLVPTAALAYTYVTDDVYGSFGQFKQQFALATKDLYTTFAAKLSGAKSQLSAAEYEKFVGLEKQRNVFVVAYGDSYGHINYDAMPSDKRAAVKQINIALQPYFEKLNHQKSSQSVLSPEQFDQYIEADMTYSTILVEAGLSDQQAQDLQQIPAAYRDRFAAAQNVLQDVARKITIQEDTPYMKNARAMLGEAEFAKFQAEMEQTTELREKYGNKQMQIDFDSVPPTVRAQMKQLLAEDRNDRDQINGWKRSQDVLSAAEYDQYLEALLTCETVMAKSGQAEINGNQVNPDALPLDLRDRFVQAKQIIDSVTAKKKGAQ